MDIRNKRVLITGSSSGIGAATAGVAASKGARIILVARSESRLKRVADAIGKAGGEAACFVADLADFAAVRRMASEVLEAEGTPDVIMNNAGSGQWKYAKDTIPEEASQMVVTPYPSAFAVTHAFLPGLIERHSGLVINVTSAAGFMAWPGATAYTAAR